VKSAAVCAAWANFNSTMVRLKAVEIDEISGFACYFNSTMVRLKDSRKQNSQQAIRHFNSTMVRLKESSRVVSKATSKISIPLWFG